MKRSIHNKHSVQFSKVIIAVVLIVGLIFIQESYVLAFLGHDMIAEELSKFVCTTIVATTLGYFLKSFNETKSEKAANLLEKKLNAEIENENCCCDEPVVPDLINSQSEAGEYDFPDETEN